MRTERVKLKSQRLFRGSSLELGNGWILEIKKMEILMTAVIGVVDIIIHLTEEEEQFCEHNIGFNMGGLI